MKKETNVLSVKTAIISFLVAVVILSFCSCQVRPNKRATVVVTHIMGGKDTLNVEYYDNLHIDDQNRLIDDNNAGVKAKYVLNYSILGTISEIK